MNDQTDSQLLRAYAENRSEAAFSELVRRHVDFVYSAARRLVVDPHLAEDVTQGVFVAFAKNARQLTDRLFLSGWLHRTAQNIAAQAVRTIERRRAREQEAVAMNELLAHEPDAAWENIAPHLDTALGELSEPDRDALLLRYFERKSAREMAQTLNVSEEAAQKRVNRAVERLREFFSKRNVTVGASGLVVLISTNAVQAAPIGLISAISSAVFSFGIVTSVTTATSATLTTMNWINTKSISAMLASVLVAGTGTYFVQQGKVTGLQNENELLRVQHKKLIDERNAALLTTSDDDPERLQKERSALLRLRNEVSLLRQQRTEFEQTREENQKLRLALAQAVENIQQVDDLAKKQKAVAQMKMNDAKQVVLGMLLFDDQKIEFPKNIEEVLPYLEGDINPNLPTAFELVYFGSLTNIESPSTTIVVREKQAFENKNGKRLKTYGFADGHSEIKMEPTEGFEAWEKARMISPRTIP